jgi:uncharacterized protein YndB with AHSA1/START domain
LNDHLARIMAALARQHAVSRLILTMAHFHITVEIQAPPQLVWAVLFDIECWPAWTPTVTNVRLLDPGPPAVGTRALVRQPKLPPAQWQITELEDGRSFAWITRAPGVLVTARHWVEGAANGSRATLSLDFSGPLGLLVARLTRGLNTRYLALEAQGLKKRAEADARSPA